MKISIQRKVLLLAAAALFISGCLYSQDIPARSNPPRLVNDFAHVLSPEQTDILERKLVALDDSTSNQIAVVLVPTLNSYPIEDYAVKLFRSWQIGNKKNNNGVLLIAAINDHAVRIEVGYGLEGAIPDITANTIIENDISPNFKNQDYFRGLNIATDDISKAAAGEYHVARQTDDNSSSGGGAGIGIIIIIIIVIFLIRRGGGGGGMMSRRGYGGLGSFFWGSLLGSGLGNRGGGFGGGGFGGGGFGGGGGGGGFGGFGGGSSGGGGASGSW